MGDISSTNSNAIDTTPSGNTGVSTPPNGGEVSSIEAAPQEQGTPAGVTPQSPQAPQGSQPPQAAGDANQANQPQTESDTRAAEQGIAKQPLTSVTQSPTQPVHPAIQRAGILHTIAQTLAGGPRYKTEIDVNTGVSKRVPVPISRGDIGLAIAMEAISGALAGLTQRGPGATGRAAAAGFQQVAGQQQQAQQEQDQQASADFARHMQIFETNMRMHQNALTAGRMGLEMNEKIVEQYKPLADMLQKDYPQAVKGIVSETDLAKYHVTKDQALPFGVTARIDPKTGEQAKNEFGDPLWDMQYLVVDPNTAGSFLTPEMQKLGAALRMPGFADSDGKASDLPMNTALKLSLGMSLQSKFTSYHLAQEDINDYYKSVNDGFGGSATAAPTKEPVMRDSNIQALVDQAADRYNVPRAIVRAVAMQESHENPMARSPKGAMGIMQLMPDTAKSLGVAHPFNAAENIDGGAKYLRQLMDNPKLKGNPKLVLAAYNAGPGAVNGSVPNIKETEGYVASISKAIGLDEKKAPTEGGAEAHKPVDLMQAIQSDPTLLNALEQFQPLLTGAGSYEKAIGELGAKDSKAAGKILQLYGGKGLVQQYDTQRSLALDAMKREQDNALDIEKKKQEALDKAAIDQENDRKLTAMLTPPASYKFDAGMLEMDQDQLGQSLQAQGIQVPRNFDDLYSMAHNLSDPKGYAARVWAKGSPGEMDLQSAREYIRKYINPNWDERQYSASQQALKRFTDPDSRTGQQIRSFNTLFDHIGDAFEAVNQLRNTNIPMLNKPLNKWRVEAEGDSTVTTVMAAIEPVKKEFMTFLLNNHALTESDKKAGDDLLAMHLSVGQLQDQLKQFAKTSALRATEVNNDYRRKFGTSIPGLISPNAVDAIKLMPELLSIHGFADLNTGGVAFNPASGRADQGQTVRESIGKDSGGGFSPTPGDSSQYPKVSRDGKIGISPDGQQYDIGTGKPLGQGQGQGQEQPAPQGEPAPQVSGGGFA